MSTLGPRKWDLTHSDRFWVSEMVAFLERRRNSPNLQVGVSGAYGVGWPRVFLVKFLSELEIISIMEREADEVLEAMEYGDEKLVYQEVIDMLPLEACADLILEDFWSPDRINPWLALSRRFFLTLKLGAYLLGQACVEDLVEAAIERVKSYESRGYIPLLYGARLHDSDCLYYVLYRLYITTVWLEQLQSDALYPQLRKILKNVHTQLYGAVQKYWNAYRECVEREVRDGGASEDAPEPPRIIKPLPTHMLRYLIRKNMGEGGGL